MNPPQEVRARFRRLRESFKLTQATVAKCLNVYDNTRAFDADLLERFENTEVATEMNVLDDLCILYMCPMSYLLNMPETEFADFLTTNRQSHNMEMVLNLGDDVVRNIHTINEIFMNVRVMESLLAQNTTKGGD